MESGPIENMKLFSGLKAISVFYYLFASSYIFIWYSYISDPGQIVRY